ncbi:MAG: SpoIIIAH-like family protein [Oscillospiraceae bacterium]
MKGPTLIRKQITMVALVFALALAVYLNWRFAQTSDGSLPVTEVLASQAGEDSVKPEDAEKYYGEALFVSTDENSYTEDYFTEARLTRSKTRDESLDTLQKSLKKTELTEAEKAQLTSQLTKTASAIAVEGAIESQVKAKGFSDCVAFLNGEKVKIVVKSGSAGLSASEVSQIKEIVIDECKINVENINILEIK